VRMVSKKDMAINLQAFYPVKKGMGLPVRQADRLLADKL